MDLTIIGLSLLCFVAAFIFFVIGIFGIPGNPSANDPMLLIAPLCWLGAAALVVAGVLGILFGTGLLAPHGLWSGDTFVAAPLVVIGAAIAIAVFHATESPAVRLGVLVTAALLIWLWQFPFFSQMLLGGLLGIVGLAIAFTFAGNIYRDIKQHWRAHAQVVPAQVAPEPAPPSLPGTVKLLTPAAAESARRTIARSAEPASYALMWNGSRVADFRAIEGLPAAVDPTARADPSRGAPEGGTLIARDGVTRNLAFVRWCASAASPSLPQPAVPGVTRAPKAQTSLETILGVEVFRGGKIFARIALEEVQVAQIEAEAVSDDGPVVIHGLTITHAGWKHIYGV